jgi:hypothetical protein
MRIYIGYDDREQVAYDVCKASILRRASIPVEVIPLKHQELRRKGLFSRTWRIDTGGQYYCEVDGRPFSTQFSHSRFLVPELARQAGHEWALFVDCDFLFLEDVAKLKAEANKNYAVQCVQHDYRPNAGIKMDGMVQQPYNRKLWSSLMLFNVNNRWNEELTPQAVNTWDGRSLHTFSWIPDHMIGKLDMGWNWIPGHSDGKPKAVHFTEGMPFMPGYEHEPHSGDWVRELVSIHHPSMVI